VVSLAVAPPLADALSVVQVFSATEVDSIVAHAVPVLELDFGGVIGDRHHGISRPADSRQARFYPKGTLIRNRRQLSLVSAEELAEVARRLDVSEVRAEWLGANLLVEGMPALSTLPPGARLLFSGGVGLVCEGVNQPCRLPAQVLQAQFPGSSAQARFVRAAFGRRGVVATVERPGLLRPGDRATIVPPELHTAFA
jgi:hypothetical protein